jgi:hypothetical protein
MLECDWWERKLSLHASGLQLAYGKGGVFSVFHEKNNLESRKLYCLSGTNFQVKVLHKTFPTSLARHIVAVNIILVLINSYNIVKIDSPPRRPASVLWVGDNNAEHLLRTSYVSFIIRHALVGFLFLLYWCIQKSEQSTTELPKVSRGDGWDWTQAKTHLDPNHLSSVLQCFLREIHFIYFLAWWNSTSWDCSSSLVSIQYFDV